MRPALVTGIEEFVTRADLLDRAIVLHLPAIPAAARQTEAAFWAAFGDAWPGLLGALLDALGAGTGDVVAHTTPSSSYALDATPPPLPSGRAAEPAGPAIVYGKGLEGAACSRQNSTAGSRLPPGPSMCTVKVHT